MAIHVGLSALETMTIGSGLVSTTTCDGNFEDLGTTIASTATTLTLGATDSEIIVVQEARSYVESLTTEELSALEERLNEKEIEIGNQNIIISEEKPKVYTK